MTSGLWQSGLRDRYGPGAPIVQRVRGYTWRGHLALETHGGENIDFALFDGSFWDLYFNWPVVADPLAVDAVFCAGIGLYLTVHG